MRFSYMQICTIQNLLAKCRGDFASFVVVFQSLRSRSRSARGGFVARCAVLAHRARCPAFEVCPYIGGLHTAISVLAVRDGMVELAFKLWHLPHKPSRVFYEPDFRLYLLDYFKRLFQELDTESSGVGVRYIRSLASCPMVTNGSDAKTSTRRRCPNYVGFPR